jgi:guanosine-3',5'-bis(diphosphate) 3'-pyrophosphohydrolase
MATLEKAIALAAGAHAGQLDKQGNSYILHPLRVMMRVQDDEARMVAVLHDTLEDTSLTEKDLREAGFSAAVIAAVQTVTRHKGQSYADYVVGCSRSEVARQVKLADLEDNARLDRMLLRASRLQDDLKRIHRYTLSYQFLTGQMSEADYRAAMSAHGG